MFSYRLTAAAAGLSLLALTGCVPWPIATAVVTDGGQFVVVQPGIEAFELVRDSLKSGGHRRRALVGPGGHAVEASIGSGGRIYRTGQPSTEGAQEYQPPTGNETVKVQTREVAKGKSVFTALPARERAVIEQAQAEKYPEEYGAQVEQYLLNLARESEAKK